MRRVIACSPVGCASAWIGRLGIDLNGNSNLPESLYSDGAHLNGHCTIHGPLQGPVWCWETGYPCAVKLNGADAILEPNHNSLGEFDGTFRYVAYASEEGKGNQRHSQILLYAAGLLPRQNVTETYYCLSGHVDDSNPQRITATQVSSFGIDRFIEAHGARVPAYPKPLAWSTDGDFRVGQVTVSDKAFTQAEYTWWTLWNRHYEDDVGFDAVASSSGGTGTSRWGWGQAGWSGGFPTWRYATAGLSRARTKLRGLPCEADEPGGTFRPQSCDEPDDPPGVPCSLNKDPNQPPSPPPPPTLPSPPPLQRGTHPPRRRPRRRPRLGTLSRPFGSSTTTCSSSTASILPWLEAPIACHAAQPPPIASDCSGRATSCQSATS